MLKKIFKFNIIALACASLALASCGSGKNTYTITGDLPRNCDAEWIYIYKVDDGTPVAIDSAKVKEGHFKIKGTAPDTVTLAFVHPGDLNSYPNVGWNSILEKGDMIADTNEQFVTGTPLNDGLKDWMSSIYEIFMYGMYDMLPDFYRERWSEHSNDFVGAYILLNTWSMLDFQFVDTLVSQIPQDIQDIWIVKRNLIEPLNAIREMQPGNPYKDLELNTLEGGNAKLSDYLGKGQYTLVDFWASWCGPCRKSMPELQGIVKKHTSLSVIGIAVNDKPSETISAVETLKIEWPVLIDTGIATGRTYGFNSIPFMMLFDAEGSIVARDFNLMQLDSLLNVNGIK